MNEFLKFYNEMMQCCDESIGLPQTSENYVGNDLTGLSPRPEKMRAYFRSTEKMDDCSRILIRNFLTKCDRQKLFDSFYRLNLKEPMSREALPKELMYSVKSLFDKKKISVSLPEVTDLNKLPEVLDTLAAQTGVDPQEIWDTVVGRMTGMVATEMTESKESVQYTLDQIRGLTDDPDSLITDDILTYQTIEERGEATDGHPYAEKIEQLKKENENDPELRDALDKANEMLVSADEDARKYSETVVEKVGTAASKAAFMDVVREMGQDEKHKDLFQQNQNLSFDYTGETTAEARLKLAKEIASENPTLSAEQQQKYKNAIDKMYRYKLFDPENCEQTAGCFRAFIQYQRLRGELAQAIESKDRDRIISLQKETSDFFTHMDEVIDDLKQINDNIYIPANTAVGRDKFMPFKYRMDAIGTSRVNSMWILLATCQEAGVNVNEIIEHPTQGFTKLFEKQLEKNDQARTFAKTTDLSNLIYEASVGAPQFSVASSSIGLMGDSMQRVLEAFTLMADGESATQLNLMANKLYPTQIQMPITDRQNAYSSYQNPELWAENIERMILVEPQDLDLFRLSTETKYVMNYQTLTVEKPFDKEEYIQTKMNPSGVVNRMVEVLQDFAKPDKIDAYRKDEVTPAVENAMNQLIRTLDGVQKSPTANAVLNTLKKGEPYAFKKTDMINLRAESKFNYLSNAKVTAEQYPDRIKQVADLQKEYNKRSFFAKIFYSSVRRQSKILDGMFDKIAADTGIKRKDLEQSVKTMNSSNGDAVAQETERVQKMIQAKELAAAVQASRNEMEKTAQTAAPETQTSVLPEEQAEFRNSIKETIERNAKEDVFTQERTEDRVKAPVNEETKAKTAGEDD